MRESGRPAGRVRRIACDLAPDPPATAGGLRTCPTCRTVSVTLRGDADGALDGFCERVCEGCGDVLGSYAGAAAARVALLWRPPAA